MKTRDTDAAQKRLLREIEKRNWRYVRKQLQSSKARHLIAARGCYEITTLGQACGHSAPLDIIEQMIDLDPTLALQKDDLGSSPLHLACLNGAAPDCVKVLIEKYPSLVPERDSDLRTPLHHAVEYVCSMEHRNDDGDRSSVLDIVQMLIDVNPETVNMTDKKGDSPMDLAHVVMLETDSSSYSEDESIFSRAGLLLRYLQQISIQVYLRNKRLWEEEGYDSTADLKPKNDSHKTVSTGQTESTADVTTSS